MYKSIRVIYLVWVGDLAWNCHFAEISDTRGALDVFEESLVSAA